jgi:outer membrane protein OmpA-like peptidoglycan-associated protein
MKKVLTIAALMFGMSAMADAQTVIMNESMSQDGTNVTVTMDIDTDQANLPSRRKEVIMPYIYNGKDTLFLDVVEVYGKGRFKRERQTNAINGDKDWALGEGQTLKKEGIYKYESQVPLKRWMKSATLGVRRQIVGCACENDLADDDLAQASLFEDPQVQRRLPAYALADVSRKWDMGQDELEIVFKVSKIDIDSSVFDNEITFKKILDAVDKIYSNPLYKVEKLVVAGYASPEGPEAFNTWLGINRAKALIDYIIKNRPEYGLTEANFEIQNGEENWAGLRRVLTESQMSGKDEVIKVIDDAGLSGEMKKRAIKAMDNGSIWDKMLKEIYPKLRSARYLAVYYDSSDDKLKEVIDQANRQIEAGEYEQAYELVFQYKDDQRAAGTIGVSLMMQKKFEDAMPWLQKATEDGCQASQKNIETIQAEYQYEEQQRKEIAEYLKKFE